MKELVYHRFLLPALDRFADRTVVRDGSYTATLGQHLERVGRLSAAMAGELGMVPGDRFGVMALNGHVYEELYHAGLLGAGLLNPLNLRLAPKELEFILRDSGTKVCFADAFFAPLVDRVRKEAGVERVVLIGSGDVPHDVGYEALLAASDPVLPAEPDEETPGLLMFTGGTTGVPKGVVLDQRAVCLNLYKAAVQFRIDHTTVYLHQAPMFHVAALGAILGVPVLGGTTTFVALFDPGAVLDTTERDGVTLTVMVPTMVSMLLDHPSFAPARLSSLRTVVYGASSMPEAVLTRLLAALPGVDVQQGYGMTESCGLLTVLGAEDHRRGGPRLRSTGRPVLGSTVAVLDTDDAPVERGATGEVCTRAGNLLSGYWNRPDETSQALRGGWYHTGDAGYLDVDGYLFLVDRVKDMIVTGGENVYSAEVENALSTHPDVAEVAVIGIPSPQWGEAVHAVVVTRPGTSPTPDALRDWARERIAGYKVPKSFELRTEPLPLSGAMKVLKRELRAPYWPEGDRAIN